jgi:hypothetical protein
MGSICVKIVRLAEPRPKQKSPSEGTFDLMYFLEPREK